MTAKNATAFIHYYPLIFVIALSIGVNGNTIFNDFVFDDVANILENPWITDVRFLPDIFSTHIAGFSGAYATSYYRPMIHVLYMAGYHVFGYAPWGFHLMNILLHAVASLLVYVISCRLFTSPGPSRDGLSSPLLAASLFAVHPIHTEAVAWVAGIMDVSFSMFYLLSFYMYLRSREETPSIFNRFYVGSLGTFCLATLCKEPALTLPLLLAAYDFSHREKEVQFVVYAKRYLPFLVIAMVYFMERVLALKGFAPSRTRTDLSSSQYVLNAFPLFAAYLGKLLLPINLSPIHIFRPVRSILEMRSMIGILVTTAFFAFCVFARKRKLLSLGLAILVIPLLPAFYIPGISGESVFAERYLYLPVFGFSVVAAFLFSRAIDIVPRKSLPAILVAFTVVGSFSIGTIVRNADWRDSHSLWLDTVKKYPQSAVAHQYLGYALFSQGRIDDAIGEYRKALELDPVLFDARFNLGVAYHAKGSVDQAIEQYQMTLKYHPGSASAHNALGMAYGRKGLLDKAIEHFQAALELDPGNADARNNLLRAYELKKTSNVMPQSIQP